MQKYFALLLTLFPVFLTAVPLSLKQCQSANDCVLVKVSCLPDAVVNKRYAEDVREEYQHMAAAIDCAIAMEKPVLPEILCNQSLCEIKGKKPNHSKCEPSPRISLTRNALLNSKIERLQVPVAHSAREAMSELKTFGPEAAVVVPYLGYLWKGITGEDCFLGYGDLKSEIVDLFQSIGPKVPVPDYFVSFYNNKDQLRANSNMESKFLNYALSIGATAAPLAPEIIQDLKKSRSGMGYRDLQIKILRNLPSQSKLSIPALKKIAADPMDMQNVEALRALAELDPTFTLDGTAVLKALQNPNQNPDRLETIVNMLPKGCPDAKLCLDALVKLTDGGSSTVMEASARAIGRFQKKAVPVLDPILETYFRTNDTSFGGVLSDALIAIDPSGEVILPHLESALKDPFKVRKAVELLERVTGEKARQTASDTRKRWKF